MNASTRRVMFSVSIKVKIGVRDRVRDNVYVVLKPSRHGKIVLCNLCSRGKE